MVDKKVLKKPAPVETTEKVGKPAAKAAPAAKEEKAPRKIGLRNFKDDQVVTLLVDYNPKRVGSASNVRFENYEDGATVKETLAAGLTSGDLSWDVAHDYIVIGDEYDEDVVKKSKPVKEPKAKKEPKEPKAKPARKGRAEPDAEEEEEEEEAE